MASGTIQEFKDILFKIEDKIDKNNESINELKIELNRINHDLYGNGKPGLFEDFSKVKPIIYNNQRQLWCLSVIVGLFVAFKDYLISVFNK